VVLEVTLSSNEHAAPRLTKRGISQQIRPNIRIRPCLAHVRVQQPANHPTNIHNFGLGGPTTDLVGDVGVPTTHMGGSCGWPHLHPRRPAAKWLVWELPTCRPVCGWVCQPVTRKIEIGR